MSALVVAYGADPGLERCVESVLASSGVEVDVVLVDNGDSSGAVGRLADRPAVQVVRPGRNTGFAEGCNLAAATAAGDVLALVNPDVVVDASCLLHLAEAALRPDVGIATASLRTAQDPELINSAGNPVHYLGLAWAGGHGEPADQHASAGEVASASGALCAMRAGLWRDLGGFEPLYFAYHEDVELSLRCWTRGLAVVYVPGATGVHDYDFTRNRQKVELLERNRWFTLLTVYSARTLGVLAPALLVLELALLGAAAAQGWLPAKLAGYRWLLRNQAAIRARRARTQRERRCDDRELSRVLAARFEPTNVGRPPGLPALNALLARYWFLVRRFL